jgi:uncharacterized membrane protein
MKSEDVHRDTHRIPPAPPPRSHMRLHLEPLLGFALGAALGLAVFLAIPASQGWRVRIGAGLDIALLGALVFPWHLILTSTPEQSRKRAAVDYPGRTTFTLIRLMTSVAGLLAAVWLLTARTGDVPSGETPLVLGLGVVAVATAWCLLHTVYTLAYAHIYYYEDGDAAGGLAFAGDRPPDDLDFAYFAFTIGMTFQTSDTSVTTRTMRHTVLGHAVLAFAFYTTIFALAVSLIAGRL